MSKVFRYNEPFHRHETRISSHFGMRGKEFHAGTDYVPYGNHDRLVRAIGDGKCISSGWHPISGFYIWYEAEIWDKRRVRILYAHLKDKPPKNAGDKIACGEWLGVMGSTGYATGLHLHLECRWGEEPNRPQDPELFLENIRLVNEAKKRGY